MREIYGSLMWAFAMVCAIAGSNLDPDEKWLAPYYFGLSAVALVCCTVTIFRKR